jgi:hypothetical protein
MASLLINEGVDFLRLGPVPGQDTPQTADLDDVCIWRLVLWSSSRVKADVCWL